MGILSSASSGVVDMLKADHKKVKGLFEEFKSAGGRERSGIAKTTIQELEVHADLEETLIYPAIRKEVDEDDVMNEAVEEHHLVHVLIKELKTSSPAMRSLKRSRRCSANWLNITSRKKRTRCCRRPRRASWIGSLWKPAS